MPTSTSLHRMPMPPSANAVWTPIAKGRMVKSKAYNEYLKLMKQWVIYHQFHVEQARLLVSSLKPGEAIEITRTYYFPKESVLTKQGRPKRNDTSNRIKVADDALAEILGCDDSLFWDGIQRKRIQKTLKEDYLNESGYMDISLLVITIDGY